MEGFADRLKILRGNLTQANFAKMFDMHRNTIFRYESGDGNPDGVFLNALCKYYKLNPEWLLMGVGPMYKDQEDIAQEYLPVQNDRLDPQPIYKDENGPIFIPQWQDPDPEMFDYIPMAETKLSAGGGAFVLSEEIEGYYAFRKSWLRRVSSGTKNLVLMRVIGDSMSPTIQEDDTVMIDIGKRSIREGMIYAVRFEDTVMIKRLTFRPGGKILIISDNRQEYESYEAEMRDLHVIGQIIFFCRSFASE